MRQQKSRKRYGRVMDLTEPDSMMTVEILRKDLKKSFFICEILSGGFGVLVCHLVKLFGFFEIYAR